MVRCCVQEVAVHWNCVAGGKAHHHEEEVQAALEAHFDAAAGLAAQLRSVVATQEVLNCMQEVAVHQSAEGGQGRHRKRGSVAAAVAHL